MVQQVIKTSPHGSFTVTQLCENIVICEDIHNKQKWSDYSFDFKDEIFEAAQLLKEEQELLGETEKIAKVIVNWLEEQLEDITGHYSNSSTLKKGVFKIELEHEKALTQ